MALYCSADYHTNNACSPVLFYEALQKVPPNAITIEIAPHALMQAILRRNLQKTCSSVGLMNVKAENELESFLQVIFSFLKIKIYKKKLRHLEKFIKLEQLLMLKNFILQFHYQYLLEHL